MASKLLKTIVGVGIALGAVPACLGRTGTGNLEPDRDDGESVEPAPTTTAPADAAPDAGPDAVTTPPDAATPDATVPPDTGTSPDADVPDGNTADADVADALAPDASTDAGDPFCDVWWPPTKGSPGPGRVPCVDPLGECEFAYPPYRCWRLIAPNTCTGMDEFATPLYCIEGAWRCPPGSTEGPGCKCWGPLGPGQSCTDAGVVEDAGSADGGGE